MEGKRTGKVGGISNCRIASDHFKKAIFYVRGYWDAAKLAEKYRKAGTKRVAIVPFLWPEDQGQYKMLGQKIVENFKQAMAIQHRDKMEYLDFVPYSELSSVLSKYDLGQNGLQFDRQNAIKTGKELVAHELIIGDISEFSITPPKTTENKKQKTTKIKTIRKKTPTELLEGRVPAREQMSFQMKLDVPNKALVLKPVFWGKVDSQEKEDAMAWFSAMYAETGVISVMSNYMSRGVEGAVEGIFTKRISLGPIWTVAGAIKLPETMKVMDPLGVRVTVPCYRPLRPDFLDTNLFIDGNRAGTLADAEYIARLALFEQFLNAASDLS